MQRELEKQQQQSNFISESSLLIMMIDATMMQSTAVKGPAVKQQIKQTFEPFFNFGRLLSRRLKKVLSEKGIEDDYEVVAPYVYECMREITKASNKMEALALLKSYNAGAVKIVNNPEEAPENTTESKPVVRVLPMPENKNYMANVAKYGCHSETCAVCGKRTAEKLFVHATTDWTVINTEQEDLSEYGYTSQGLFPIGPECAKKLPPEFIFRSE